MEKIMKQRHKDVSNLQSDKIEYSLWFNVFAENLTVWFDISGKYKSHDTPQRIPYIRIIWLLYEMSVIWLTYVFQFRYDYHMNQVWYD